MGVIVRLLMAAAIGYVVTGFAQSRGGVRLHGRVLSENQSPVRGASIAVLNASARADATTGPSGEFAIELGAPGEYLVEAQQEGYYRLRKPALQLQEGENEVLLVLTFHRELAQSVTVESALPGIDHSRTSAERVLTGKQIIEVPYPSTHSLRHALRVMPAVVHDSQSGLHVDGGAENQLQYSLDGFNVADPLTGRFEARVSVEAVQAVEIASGSLVAEYGKGSAGTMAIRTKTGDDRLRFTATNFIPGISRQKGWMFKDWTPRFGVSGPVKKGRAWFSNQVDTQYIMSIVDELPQGQDRAPSWRLSNMLQTQVNLTASNILSAGFLANLWNAAKTGLSAIDPMETTVDRRSRQWFAYLRDQMYFSRGMLVELGYARNRTFGREIPQGHEPLLLTPEGRRGNYFVDATRTGGRDQVTTNMYFPTIAAMGEHRLKAGIDLDRVTFWQQARRSGYQHHRPDGSVLTRVAFGGPDTFQVSSYEASAFVQDSWRPTPTLLIESGLRQDWDRLVGSVNLAPRVGASWSPGQRQMKFYVGYSILYDATNLRAFGRPLDQYSIWTGYAQDGRITGGPAITLFTIPRRDFSAPRYVNLNLGFERVLPKGVFLRVNALRKRGRNGFTYEDVTSTGVPLSPQQQSLLGDRVLAGLFELRNERRDVYDSVELMLRQTFLRRYEWMASYRRSRALSNGVMDLTVDEPTRITSNVGRLPWDTPNRFLGWGYFPLPRKDWAVAYLLEYRNGFPFSVQDGEGRQVGDINGFRFPTFFELNLHVERTFRMAGRQWAVRAGFLNLTGRQNPTTVNNNMASAQFMSFYGGQRRALNFRIRWVKATE